MGPVEDTRRRDTTRWLPMAATGLPAPFRLGGPAYLAALLGWRAAAILFLAESETSFPNWQAEVVLFAPGAELLALGVLLESAALARVGGVLLVAAAAVALACGVETVRRAARGMAG